MGGRRRAESPVSESDPIPGPDAARQIWLRAVGDAAKSAEQSASADQLCADLRIGMVRWIGGEAYRALLGRVLVETRHGHPALAELTCFGEDEPAIRAAVRKHGADAVAAGMVAILTAMIALLGRLMGDEMALHLVKQNCLPTLRAGGNLTRAEEQA
ncbi:MAG: hypothetical protein ABR551_13505 [Gemmatimonadales bacterium]